MNGRLISILILAILAFGVIAVMAMNRRLRSTLAGVLVVDCAVLSVVLGLLTQRPIERAIIVVAAIAVSFALFAYLSPQSFHHVLSEHKADRHRFFASFAACVLCTAMFTAALGVSRSVHNGESQAVLSELGAVDLLISAPNVAALSKAQSTVRDLSGQAELASLFDAEPLPMRTISGAILTNGSPAPVRLIEMSTLEAAGFGRSPQTSGVAGIELGAGDALLSQKAADLLAAQQGDSVRIRMFEGKTVDLKLKAVIPSVGIVGLPLPNGQTTTNVIVGPGTLASVPESETQYLLALSLCGGPSSRVLSNGVYMQCSSDPIESKHYVERVDRELARAFGALASAINDDALFAEEVDQSTIDNGLSVLPVKLRVVEEANRDYSAIQRVLDLSALPVALSALSGLVGVALVSRTRRIRIDKIVGMNSMRSIGEQGLFVALSSFPATVLGSVLGVLVVRIGVVVARLISQGRPTSSPSLLGVPSSFQLFADGFAGSLGITVFAALSMAWVLNRTKEALATQQISKKRGLIRCILGVSGLIAVIVLLKLVSDGGNVYGIDAGSRSSFLLIATLAMGASLCWVLFARGSNAGSLFAGVALPASERNLLKLLRSRSVRRNGLWELGGPVLLSFSLGTTVALAGVLGASASAAAQVKEAPFVEVNDVYSNGEDVGPSPMALGSGQVIETRTTTARGQIVSNSAVVVGNQSTSATRQLSIGRLTESNVPIFLKTFGVSFNPGVGEVVAGRNEYNRVFGLYPRLGDTVQVIGPSGLLSLRISSVVDGTSNALWVNDTTWAELGPTKWFGQRLVTPAPRQSVKETRRDLKAALRGRAVTIPDQITPAVLARSDAARMSRQLRWIGLLLGIGALGALMVRWGASRRKELAQLRLSTIAQSTVTRSISHDLVGHAFLSALAGMGFGGVLALMLARFSDLASSVALASPGSGATNWAWVYLLVAVGLFFGSSYLSARFGSGHAAAHTGRSAHAADTAHTSHTDAVTSAAESEAAMA